MVFKSTTFIFLLFFRISRTLHDIKSEFEFEKNRDVKKRGSNHLQLIYSSR